MTALLRQVDGNNPIRTKRIQNIKGWLRGDPRVDLGDEIYTADGIDQSARHTMGHSAPAYYPKIDERNTRDLAKRGIDRRYKSYADMGVGGAEAVHNALDLAEAIGANNYLGFDLSPHLADDSARIAISRGFKAQSFCSDIFEPLPIHDQRDTLMGVLGLTIQNPKPCKTPELMINRIISIYRNYARALTSSDPDGPSNSGLLVAWDANMHERQNKDCYENPEFEQLMRGLFGNDIPVDKFNYYVTAKTINLGEGRSLCELEVGLSPRVPHTIHFEGERFPVQVGKLHRIVGSPRFNIALMVDMIERGGFAPSAAQRWSATNRVQYQHCHLGS